MTIASSKERRLHAAGQRSLGVTLPPDFCKRYGLTRSASVQVEDCIEYVVIRVERPDNDSRAGSEKGDEKKEQFGIF